MKIKDILSKKIKEILRNKIKLTSICIVSIILICAIFYSFKFTYAVPENDNYNFFFPDISEHSEPTELLVLVFLYDDYIGHNEGVDRVFSMTDEEIQSKYYNEIFGSGNIEEQSWSVNDYYKENSNGKFYFNPVLINDDNGIHLIKFNKTYDMENFSSDITEGFKTLIDKGFNPEGYGMRWNNTDKKKILCIFPKILVEHFGGYSINENKVADMAITTYSSIPSTTIHELGHALGLPDLYNQGSQATLMSTVEARTDVEDIRYPESLFKYNIQPHMDPFHKIALGWYNYEIIDSNTTIKLYPTTSSLYNPIIVPTGDNNQYYIIENRIATSFESQITKYYSRADVEDSEDAGFSSYEGINIWRVDELGYNSMNSSEYSYDYRKGDFVIGNLKYENDTFFPKKYLNSNDISNLKENTNIKITYLKNNLDGSVDVEINFDDKYKNTYIVRYNANNETNDYLDKTYSYSQKVDFLYDLFYKDDYKIVEWNTMPDGSGIGYKVNYYNEVYGLTDGQNGVVNLYAQWKKTKNVISFNSNGGIGTMEDIELSQDIINDGYILPEPKFTSPNSNLIFKGWYVPEYDSIKQPSEKVYLTTDNILVAQWGENNNCIINFNSNGGTNIDSQQIIKGNSVIEPEPPIKDGYIFGGWYIDDMYTTTFYFGQFIYSDLTLYAKWIPNENILKNIDLKIELPKVGDNVTIEKYEDMDFWDWNSQKPQMKIIISGDEHYHLSDGNGTNNYMHWITKDYFNNILDPYAEEPFIGNFEYDKTYYARIFLEANENYLFDKDIKITINGSDSVKIVYAFENFLDIAVEINIPKEKEELRKYTILDGANQNYSLDSEKDLIIKVDGEISNLEGIKVDDEKIDKENYTLISGSTILTLKQAYLKTLEQGTHKITFIYKDGEVSTSFTIEQSKIGNNDEGKEEVITTTKPIENVKENNNLSTTTKPVENMNNNLPTTGDAVIIWEILFIIGLGGSIITYKKIRSKHESN